MIGLLFGRVGIAMVLVAAGGGIAYWLLGGESERDLNSVMQELSIRASEDFAKQLPRVQDVEDLLVVPLVGGRQEDSRLAGIVSGAVERQRKYTVWSWAALKKNLGEGDRWGWLLDQAGIIPGQRPKTVEQARKIVSRLKTANRDIDGVLFIKCRFDQGPRLDCLGASVELTGTFYDGIKKTTVGGELTSRAAIESAWNHLYLTHKVGTYSFLGRLLIWVLIASIQPFLLIAVARWGLKQKNNLVNMALLAGMTLVSTSLAWVLILSFGLSFMTLAVVVVMGAGLGYYNYDALDYIERRLL